MTEPKRIEEQIFLPSKALAKEVSGPVANLAEDENIARPGTMIKQ